MSWWRKLFAGQRPATLVPPVQEPSADDIQAASLLVKLYERPAWIPQTVAEDHGAAASKFGGMALVSAEHPAPNCPSCGQPMPLFLQLNPADLPVEMAAKLHGKVLQLFYCISEVSEEPPHSEYDCERFSPYRRGVVVRLVPVVKPATGALPSNSFPARTIVNWVAFDEAPHFKDWAKLGFPAGLSESVVIAKAASARCSGRDKLGSWPYWSAGAAWHTCTECLEPMDPLFQLVSKEHIPYTIGNGARGHIWQCMYHPDALFFYWDEQSLFT